MNVTVDTLYGWIYYTIKDERKPMGMFVSIGLLQLFCYLKNVTAVSTP